MIQPGKQSVASSKTRVRLGSGGFLFLLVSGLILAAAIYTNAPLLYGGFGLLMGALCVSGITLFMMMQNLSVERVLPPHGVAGQLMVIRYQVTNAKRWMPAFTLILREKWETSQGAPTQNLKTPPLFLSGQSHGWILHLGANRRVQAESPCWPVQRGKLSFNLIELSCSFPFGILRWSLTFEQPQSILVYPQLFRIHRHLMARISHLDPHGRQNLDRAGGFEEFYGLREYRMGDSLKLVDWRHTARTGKLISREMTLPSPPKVILVLDLTPPPLPSEAAHSGKIRRLWSFWRSESPRPTREQNLWLLQERAISLAASIVCDAYLQGHQVGLSLVGVPFASFAPHHSLPHRTRILDALSQLHLTPSNHHQNLETASSPTITIRLQKPPEAPSAGAGLNEQTLYASEMPHYIMDMNSQNADSLLSDRVGAVSRRQKVQRQEA